uniref:(northern house mosquito) hypothetical protein n=1 Tax=Culex pipiens TaxID=7175 RepID=A0A8D8BFV2_CULPI
MGQRLHQLVPHGQRRPVRPAARGQCPQGALAGQGQRKGRLYRPTSVQRVPSNQTAAQCLHQNAADVVRLGWNACGKDAAKLASERGVDVPGDSDQSDNVLQFCAGAVDDVRVFESDFLVESAVDALDVAGLDRVGV